MSKTIQRLEGTFPPEITDALVEAIMAAYEVTHVHYAPQYGHDAMTFGLMLYKSKVHFIKGLAERYEWLQIVSGGACFRFKIGSYTLATHRIGDSANENVSDLFPSNKTAAPKMAQRNKRQLALPFPTDEVEQYDDSDCDALILADIGNHEQGFLQLYLNIPIDVTEDGRVGKWGTIHQVWSDEMYGRAHRLEADDRAPEETVAPPTITLKESAPEEETITPPVMELRDEQEAEDKKRNESK